MGGATERADYSTRQNGLFYSAYMQTSQEHIKAAIEWAFKRFFRSIGITDDPIYTSKSVNVDARMVEAKAFQEIMTGIKSAVESGMPLPLAIEFFEEEAGQTFSADLKAKIEEQYVPPTQTDKEKMKDGRAQDNKYLASSIVEYLNGKQNR